MITVPDTLKTLESMVIKSAGLADTPTIRAALDILEYLIPLFRSIKPDRDTWVRFVRIREGVYQLLGRRMDSLAREYAVTHDPTVKKELERLSLERVKLMAPWKVAAKK